MDKKCRLGKDSWYEVLTDGRVTFSWVMYEAKDESNKSLKQRRTIESTTETLVDGRCPLCKSELVADMSNRPWTMEPKPDCFCYKCTWLGLKSQVEKKSVGELANSV